MTNQVPTTSEIWVQSQFPDWDFVNAEWDFESPFFGRVEVKEVRYCGAFKIKYEQVDSADYFLFTTVEGGQKEHTEKCDGLGKCYCKWVGGQVTSWTMMSNDQLRIKIGQMIQKGLKVNQIWKTVKVNGEEIKVYRYELRSSQFDLMELV